MLRGLYLIVAMTLVFTISAKAANVTVNVDYTNPQAPLSPINISAGAFTITIPAKSIVTVVG